MALKLLLLLASGLVVVLNRLKEGGGKAISKIDSGVDCGIAEVTEDAEDADADEDIRAYTCTALVPRLAYLTQAAATTSRTSTALSGDY